MFLTSFSGSRVSRTLSSQTLPWRWVTWLLILSLGCFLPLSLFADLKKRTEEGEKKEKKQNRPEIIVPEAKGGVVSFVESRSVEIPLLAATSSLLPVEFLIREMPRYGTLSNLRLSRTDNHRATITYTHQGGPRALSDSFVFACRVNGGPISAPARVELQGVPNAPSLEVQVQPLIVETFVGASSKASFTLVNRGTAAFIREFTWPEGFQGPSLIRVEAGAVYTGEVDFIPTQEKTYREDITLQRGKPASELRLLGAASRDLTVSPGLLSLIFEPNSGKRLGELTLVNRGQTPMNLRFGELPRLSKLESMTLPPLGNAKVVLELPAEDSAAFEGELVVEGAIRPYKVKVQAEPTPGTLHIAQPQEKVIDFGTLEHDATKTQSVIVQNIGGQALVANVVVTPPFRLKDSNTLLKLEPGKMKMFEVELEAKTPGMAMSTFEVSTTSQKLHLQLKAQIQEDPRMAEEIKNPTKHLGKGSNRTSTPRIDQDTGERLPSHEEMVLYNVLMSEGVPIPEKLINPHTPPTKGMQLNEMGRKHLVVSWQMPDKAPEKWIVQMSQLLKLQAYPMPVKVWSTVGENVEFLPSEDPSRVVVKLSQLKAGTQYEVRVLAMDEKNLLSRPGETMMMSTMRGAGINPWFWRLPLAGLLIYAILYLRKKRLGLI